MASIVGGENLCSHIYIHQDDIKISKALEDVLVDLNRLAYRTKQTKYSNNKTNWNHVDIKEICGWRFETNKCRLLHMVHGVCKETSQK